MRDQNLLLESQLKQPGMPRRLCVARRVESFVKTTKRDYVAHMPKPDRETALRKLAIAFEHFNEQHSHSAVKYRSPREFRRLAAAAIQAGVGVRFGRASPLMMMMTMLVDRRPWSLRNALPSFVPKTSNGHQGRIEQWT
jgi:putative transposase